MKSISTQIIMSNQTLSKVIDFIRWSLITIILSVGAINAGYSQDIFDLALSIYPTDDTPVQPGDVANFTIRVYNQGDIDARNVKIVDYIPAGLQFTSTGNAGWSSIGTRAITTITDVIPAGEFYTLQLNLQLRSSATPQNIYNFAEIALSQDADGNDTTLDDEDSTADSQNDNDNGASAFTDTDDFLDGDGIMDEDDHDVALLIICGQNACNDQVNISLNAACSIEILADMIVENPDYPDGAYTVILEDSEGNTIPGSMIDGSFVGETISVTAFIEGCEESSCWGLATIEDKFAIDLFCQVDTVDCGGDDPDVLGLPLAPGTSFFKINDNSYVVPGVNNCSDIVLSYEDNIEMLPCQTGSPYVARILRDFVAEDGEGNIASCTSEIYIRKGNLSDVIAPPDFQDDPLECNSYPTLPNGNPDPSFTGFPEGTNCPNIISVYEDLEVPSSQCPGVYDIVREWTVIDWCNSNDTTFQQIIKIMDTEAPSCEAPSKFFGTNFQDLCFGSVDVVDPFLSDDCSEITYTIAYKPFVNNDNNYENLIEDNVTGTSGDYVIFNIPVGEYRIAYFAEDACGNTSQCLGRFEVRDDQEPTPNCIIETSVTLNSFGNASINAIDLDAGSFDNCGIQDFRVRRMNGEGCFFGDQNFSSTTNFCCADAGQTVMVVFRVRDNEGNTNDCMVAVHVIDDQVPTITCPPDFTFTCTQYDNFNGSIPLYITGNASASDNCNVSPDYFDTQAFNECGVGIIVRNWSVIDQAGNAASCKQYFEIISDFQFDANMIQWPNDTGVNQCLNDEITTGATGFPILPTESCSNFTVEFDDEIIDQEGAGCGIVERTFTVTDNCALDPQNNSFSYVQQIEVFENEDPVFLNCKDTIIAAQGGDCDAFFSFQAVVVDNCTATNKLKNSYTVDYFNDGTIDDQSNGKTLQGNFPGGTHRAVFFSEDECGNIGTCAFLFTVQDSKFPTPICYGLSVALDENGEVEVWASDFNLKSFDNCTAEADLMYSFSTDVTDVVRTFDCGDLGNGVIGYVSVQMYVWDQAGNYDFCTVVLTITDTQDVCPDSGTITAELSGKIMTSSDEDFKDVEVMIYGDDMNEKINMSDISGDYTFNALSLYDNYTVIPSKNDDVLNGITTLDIIQIQKHILGLSIFTEHEQLVAADVNNSKSITGGDIIQLRRLILGLYVDDVLPNNNSWRFIPSEFEVNLGLPYEFPESVVIENLLDSQSDISFNGIKIGDVNNSSSVNFNSEDSDTRSAPEKLSMNSFDLSEGQSAIIPVTIDRARNISGFQLKLEFDESLEIDNVSSPTIDISEENYSIENGELIISWGSVEGVDVDADAILFTLHVTGHRDIGKYDEMFTLSSNFETEIFDVNLELQQIELEYINHAEKPVKSVQLLQNYPNPFTVSTTIDFEMQKTEELILTIYSANGNLIYSDKRIYKKGANTLIVDRGVVATSGVYYSVMETDSWSSAVKIICMD